MSVWLRSPFGQKYAQRLWRKRWERYGLRTTNHAQATAVKGLLGIRIARDIRFWTANRRVRGKSPAVLLTWEGRCRSERIRAEPIWEIPDEQRGCKHLPP
jgi:hypothetical protein